MSAEIAIVGIGEDGLAGLRPPARRLVDGAELLVGGERHLAMLGEDPRPRLAWLRPLEATFDLLRDRPARKVVVLASGDPSWFGVAKSLRAALPDRIVHIEPHPASMSLACAALGWPVEDTTILSAHGRPLDVLRRHLMPSARLLVLLGDAADLTHAAELLRDEGYPAARLHVLERLGGMGERIVSGPAGNPPSVGDHLTLVGIEAGPGTNPRSSAPGLPDGAFEHDGQLTKREVRAITLAHLQPLDGQLLWDVGAGAGSIAIEWLRATRRGAAIAIERDAERALRIVANARRLGVPELRVVQGEAPDTFDVLAEPDAIFVGGSVARAGMLDAALRRLRAGGRLVANAVTLDGEAALAAFSRQYGGDLVRIAVSRSGHVGARAAWRPLLPVTQLVLTKPCDVAS